MPSQKVAGSDIMSLSDVINAGGIVNAKKVDVKNKLNSLPANSLYIIANVLENKLKIEDAKSAFETLANYSSSAGININMLDVSNNIQAVFTESGNAFLAAKDEKGVKKFVDILKYKNETKDQELSDIQELDFERVFNSIRSDTVEPSSDPTEQVQSSILVLNRKPTIRVDGMLEQSNSDNYTSAGVDLLETPFYIVVYKK